MKSLVVYYSFSGNTRLIAESIAKAVDADIEELKPKKPLNASGAGYVVWGLRQLMSQSKPILLPLEHDLNAYDLIIIGTPVWLYTVAPPIRTFISDNKNMSKKVALFCCHGGNFGKTIDYMKTSLADCKIIGTADFNDPLKNNPDENCKKSSEWIKCIVKQR